MPSTASYAPAMPVQYEQAGYYQAGGMQASTMQPPVAYGTTAPGMQPMMFEQQPAGQPCMAMTMPGGEQMMTQQVQQMEPAVGVPQQTEAVATPVMEQPAVLTSKKAKKKLATKKREKACC